MSTYQDVVNANRPYSAWAFSEMSGTDFAPYTGPQHYTGSGALTYQQAGPFANSLSLGLAIGAKLATPMPYAALPPLWYEIWFKLAASPPAANGYIMYVGNASANGYGLYVGTDGKLHILHGGVLDTNTQYVIDNAWHVYQYGGNELGAANVTVRVDGLEIWHGTPSTPVSPSPNNWYLGGDSGGNTAVAKSIALPAWYPHELSSGQAYASKLAATDPEAALAITMTGGGQLNTLLLEILAAVKRTY